MIKRRLFLLAASFLVVGCDAKKDQAPVADAAPTQVAEPQVVAVRWDPNEPRLEDLEKGRMDMSWQEVVALDTTASGRSINNPEKWGQITPDAVNRGGAFLPLDGDVAGPSVFRVQVLLDRAMFSPGMIDGRWGKNVAKAVYWLQSREGLPATGRVDSATYVRLTEIAGKPTELVRAHTLTAEDVKGPFVKMPEDIYEQAKLKCSCYESLTEKLTEQFHITADLLRQLNPGMEIDGLTAGSRINVPHVRDESARREGRIARIEVSGRGSFVNAVDSEGRVLYHFPSTLGSTYDPSPSGSFKVTSVTPDPWWHYQPAILAHVSDDKPDAKIPPGPNSAVGKVWIDLSEPHYGIHGTKSPETIGYATSAGCVRLTNWDALFLSKLIGKGTPVVFRDTRPAGSGASSASAAPPRDSARASSGRQTRPRRDSTAGSRDTTRMLSAEGTRPRTARGAASAGRDTTLRR